MRCGNGVVMMVVGRVVVVWGGMMVVWWLCEGDSAVVVTW